MAKVKISNIVYRLKNDNTLEVPSSEFFKRTSYWFFFSLYNNIII